MRTSPHASTGPATVRLRSPGEIVSAVPFLLGFAPEESLVVIGLRGRGLVLTCRLDLEDLDQCVGSVLDALRHAGADRVLLVAFAATREAARVGSASMARLLRAAGLGVGDRISVVAQRWFDEECSQPRCCPTDGVPVADHDASPATMTLQALSPGTAVDRAALVAECHPDRPVLQGAVRSELRSLLTGCTGLDSAEPVESLVAILGWGEQEPSPAQFATAAWLTAMADVRDVWYALVAPEILGDARPELEELHATVSRVGAQAGDLGADGRPRSSEMRSRLLRRILSWVRSLPDDVPEATMPALVVAAAAHWCAGDGARARVLVERAHRLDTPPLPMLETLSACLTHGIGPTSGFGPGSGADSRAGGVGARRRRGRGPGGPRRGPGRGRRGPAGW